VEAVIGIENAGLRQAAITGPWAAPIGWQLKTGCCLVDQEIKSAPTAIIDDGAITTYACQPGAPAGR
jgi:hypothetical protein